MIKLYNTLTRQKDELKPLKAGQVSFYNCGLTVYSQPHIGNWVGYIYWDVLTRLLGHHGLQVNRVQNITDVGHLTSDDDAGEDKMEKGARSEGLTAWDVAEKYIAIADHEGYELLGLKQPKLIRATNLIDQQIEFVKQLEKAGFTYEIPGDGLYFDTAKLKDYGKLAKLDIAGLEAGARVSVEGKKNITDFAVWKFSPEDQKRDMEWDSPWGKGFPGWHLECSVIAREGLGDQIDIHAGGVDHIPVHHTNEIAQTESLTGKQFAQIWLHNNHLRVNDSKMSKSLGNVYSLQDILDKSFSLQAFKLLILSKHYRTEGNFTWTILEAAQNRLNNWQAVADRSWQLPGYDKDISEDIVAALDDDLDTPKALAIIDVYFDDVEKAGRAPAKDSLTCISDLLGIDLSSEDISSAQKLMLEQRRKARDNKDWQKSDELRDHLLKEGIGIKDTPQGQLWFKHV
ncbi:cysteine--tRNA ligase [Candidatus Saccharibacteria bacterium]|nr:cysteine--tRNA ligase [Candidatus Saccharibacteria bacterium]MCB9821492.1 cysteine--tRNA ligase [Candidatus Nomurabacteria bacterium]